MTLTPARLGAVVEELARRPGHEKVRTLIHELCVVGLGVSEREIDFEVPLPEVRGRMDALFGDTVFEFKTDLKREGAEAERQLSRYLGQREKATGRRYLGIATDGAGFVAYQLDGRRLTRLDEHYVSSEDPRALLRWLDTAVSLRRDLLPEADIVRDELGRESLVYRRAILELRQIWADARQVPEAELKRLLWGRHLEFIYGTLVDADELFLQHSYLTLVAKIMAARALALGGGLNPDDLLDGTPFVQSGLDGAVEVDFFDWVRLVPQGRHFIERLIRQVDRFRLEELEVDVLKVLYESLIDPRQRHYLGEYYTPDWLARLVVEKAVDDPIRTRVLDPACGSGTFLFHAVRHYIEAAERASIPPDDVLAGCVEHVFGVDVHPVAVLFARVSYLLALGPARLRAKRIPLHVPVYLGDSLQWNVNAFLSEETVDIAVPDGPLLRFPASVAGDAPLLEAMLGRMDALCVRNAPLRTFESWLNSRGYSVIASTDRKILGETYERLRELHWEGRNHVWVYVVRNLTRPLWLTLREGKPDVVIGNPPWLKFNAMSADMQRKFREECRARNLWAGGNVATHQDLSAYFYARCVERYLRVGGRIAFVLPLAALSRAYYAPFRTGKFGEAMVRFTEAWTFDADVKPLFPVPAAVLFGERSPTRAALPAKVTAFHGDLPRRNASPTEALVALVLREEPWPTEATRLGGSPYRKAFRNGATILPRKCFLVVEDMPTSLGTDPEAPVVYSERRAQEKHPWKALPVLKGQVERQFLRPLMLGESIAPYRVLTPSMAVIPWDDRLLDAQAALEAGHIHLADWLAQAEAMWNRYGKSAMTLSQQIDYFRKLAGQFPLPPIRVIYGKSGKLPASAILRDRNAIVDHKLYWYGAASEGEAYYLVAILNSETVRARVEPQQSRGQFGARDFDKVMFGLPIPRFDANTPLHAALADAARDAERIAGTVEIREGDRFQTARKRVRQALIDSGVANRIEVAVADLIGIS